MSRPKKFLIWLLAMSSAAPAVKPMMTVCEMKLTSTPSRASPIASWIRPVSRVSVSTRLMNCALPGSASGLIEANTTIEIAVVGPDTRCQLDPHSAPTMAGTIAAYRPYSGGSPAMVANATACGSTMSAPVKRGDGIGLERLRGDIRPPAQEGQQTVQPERAGVQIDHANSRSILANNTITRCHKRIFCRPRRSSYGLAGS